jgi:isopentenyldiphosphate isomerase
MSDTEILDVMDGNGNVVRSVTRDEADRNNHIIFNVVVFVFTPTGEVWIQKRARTKKRFPGIWDVSVCGCIAQGEQPEESARREVQEEMSMTCALYFAETFLNEFLEDGIMRRRQTHLFVSVSDQMPQPNEEVEEFVAVPADELVQKIQQHPEEYVPSFLMELEKARNAYSHLSTPKNKEQ